MSENESSPLPLMELLPYLAAAVIAAVMIVALMLRFSPLGAAHGAPTVVTFDVVKYTNSQRAVASAFIKPGSDIARANELLLNVPERTRVAIEEIAGEGTLVMVKQAVVQGQFADITDDVLKKLGLPTDVPTSDATAAAIDIAPTSLTWKPNQRPTATTPVQGANNQEILP